MKLRMKHVWKIPERSKVSWKSCLRKLRRSWPRRGRNRLIPKPATDTAVPAAAAHAQTTSNNDFRPHSSQKPNYLEKSSSHLEVKTFCEQIQAYIITGYRSAPPPQGVWFHIKACMHSTWYTALEQKGALNESLEKILEGRELSQEPCTFQENGISAIKEGQHVTLRFLDISRGAYSIDRI